MRPFAEALERTDLEEQRFLLNQHAIALNPT
jgi:hypothetical protein